MSSQQPSSDAQQNPTLLPTLAEFCQLEVKHSFKCLEENGFDRKKCKDVFQDYQCCKRTWQKRRKANNRGG